MSLPIHIAFDGLPAVDGSARFTFGSTTAVASVSGPIPARPASEHPVRATIDVHVRPLVNFPGTNEKHTATRLKGILERACLLSHHPRTLVQVVVQALSPSRPSSSSSSQATASALADANEELLLAAEINASSLALLNAGSIPLRGVVCAIAIVQPASTTSPQLVTQSHEFSDVSCAGCFAFLFGVDQTAVMGGGDSVPPGKLIWTNYRARPGSAFSATALAEAERVALEGAIAVWTKMKASLADWDGLS